MAPKKIMMDSGAFSVWNKGAEVDVDAYIDFCLEHLDVVDVFVALDVIPGVPGSKTPTPIQIGKACEKGWKNYERMIERGLKPERIIHVFHQFDDFAWLARFLKEGVPYIGLSTRKTGATRHQHQAWLDSCMNYVTDSNGKAKVKLHGFGITSLPIIVRYPWTSVDSSTALKEASFGVVSIPVRKDSHWDFLQTPRRLAISSRCNDASLRGAHYLTIPPKAQELVQLYLKEEKIPVGTSTFSKKPLDYKYTPGKEAVILKEEDSMLVEKFVEKGVVNHVAPRTLLNIRFFEHVEEAVRGKERVFKPMAQRKSLLPTESRTEGKSAPIVDSLEVFIAGCNSGDAGADSALRQAKHRLLSYHYAYDSQRDEFQTLIKKRRKNGGH